MTAPTAIFRTDSSPSSGAGHLTRCLALAGRLRERGWSCSFVLEHAHEGSAIAAGLRRLPVRLVGADEAPVAAVKSASSEGCDLLVVDHYRLGLAFESACRGWARRILVIDDLADRDHDADYLLNQAPGVRAQLYCERIPDTCRPLLGGTYALLRPEFSVGCNRRKTLPTSRPVRLLVATGAYDLERASEKALRGIALSGVAAEIRVVLGRRSPNLRSVRALVRQLGVVASLVVDPPDMAGLMAWADLAIGAPGVSSLERCALRLPSIMFVLADNQTHNARALETNGAAVNLGAFPRVPPSALAKAIRKTLSNPLRLARIGACASRLCDGRGAERVAEILNRNVRP